MQKRLLQEHAEFLRLYFPHTSIRKLRTICEEHEINIRDLLLLFINLNIDVIDRNYDIFGFIETYWAKTPLQFVNGLCVLAVECRNDIKRILCDIFYLLKCTNADIENGIAVDCDLWHIEKKANCIANSHNIFLLWKKTNRNKKPFLATLCKYGYCTISKKMAKYIHDENNMHPFDYYANTYINMCETDELAMQNRYLAIPRDVKIREYCKKKNAVISHLQMVHNRMRMLFVMEIEERLHGGNVLLADIFIVKTICKYFWIVDEN